MLWGPTEAYFILSLSELFADSLKQLLHFSNGLIQPCSHLLLLVHLLLSETQPLVWAPCIVTTSGEANCCLLPSVTTDCCSRSSRQCCPSDLRAPPGWVQETAGPAWRNRTFSKRITTQVLRLNQDCPNVYLVKVTSNLLPLVLLRLQLGQRLRELSFQLKSKHLNIRQPNSSKYNKRKSAETQNNTLQVWTRCISQQ